LFNALFFTKASVLRAVAGPISVVATSATMYGVYRASWPFRGYVYVFLAVAIFLIYLTFLNSLLTLINRGLIHKFAAVELRVKTEEIAAQIIIACITSKVFNTLENDDDLVKREAWRPFKRFCN